MLSPSGSCNNGANFGETAWSVVLAAGNVSESRAREALAELCQMYWPPIYAYLRQRGFNRHDAQDLTQIFFQRIVEDETLRRASPARGRFRSFLLGALTRCLADEQAYLRAVKRGGGAQFISMDEVAAEEMHHQRVTMNLTPADSLDARWARCARNFRLTEERKRLRRCRRFSRGKNRTLHIRMPRSEWDWR